MSGAFAARFPLLFHVTEAAALPSIARHGLLSAEALAALLGVTPDLGANRRDWMPLASPRGEVVLRRQGLPDAALRRRLDPAISLESWRRFINAQVFLFPGEAAARRLLRAEPGRVQAILAIATRELLAAGCDLRSCRFNNGHIDRSPPNRRRLRGFADYRPVAEWQPGLVPRELAVAGRIPPTISLQPCPTRD